MFETESKVTNKLNIALVLFKVRKFYNINNNVLAKPKIVDSVNNLSRHELFGTNFAPSKLNDTLKNKLEPKITHFTLVAHCCCQDGGGPQVALNLPNVIIFAPDVLFDTAI